MCEMLLRNIVMLCCLAWSGGACAGGEWRGFVPGRGMVCVPCSEQHYCPDGESMHKCSTGMMSVGKNNRQCCDRTLSCEMATYAVGRDCSCRPMACPEPHERLVQYNNENGRLAFRCVSLPECNPCPDDNWWVQTTSCQCMRRAKCDGGVWRVGEGEYECFNTNERHRI